MLTPCLVYVCHDFMADYFVQDNKLKGLMVGRLSLPCSAVTISYASLSREGTPGNHPSSSKACLLIVSLLRSSVGNRLQKTVSQHSSWSSNSYKLACPLMFSLSINFRWSMKMSLGTGHPIRLKLDSTLSIEICIVFSCSFL